jgi:hypothetical protein
MRTFTILWFGQLVSGLGSSLSGFAFGVWIFEQTGSATQFALTTFAYVMPSALFAAVAGVFVDRWDRRWTMLLSDTGQALATVAIALLLFHQQLVVWHIYVATIISAILGSFQGPAYGASVALLAPKQHLARAAGMAQISRAISRLVAPLLAGFLVITIGLEGVVLIDVVTFLIAIATYLIIRIPRPPATPEATQDKGSFWREARFGWHYLLARPGLFGLILIGAILNFFGNIANILTVPMVLSFADADALGVVLAVSATGLLIGGGLMSAWGGPKRRMNGALSFVALSGVGITLAGWLPSIPLVAAGRFLRELAFSGVNALGTAIEQSKVAPAVQGRVFGVAGMIALLFEAAAYPTAGFLADHLFEPLMAEDGVLAGTVGTVMGVGPGRGMGLMSSLMGACEVVVAIAGYLYPRTRLIEDELPDMLPNVAENSPVSG